METITNIASTVTTTASKAIWGDQTHAQTATQGNETAGKEPVSGQLGKGTAEEPYDLGNAATPGVAESKPLVGNDKDNENSLSRTNETHTDTPSGISKPTEARPLESTEKTGVTLKNPEPLKLTATDTTAPELSTSGTLPISTELPSAIATKDNKDSSDKTLAELAKSNGPNDHSGEPVKVHDDSEPLSTTQKEHQTPKPSNPSGQEHGAEKEADRLLEEKNAKKSETGATGTKMTAEATTGATMTTGAATTKIPSNETPASEKESHSPDRKEKMHHTIDKIKNKLHIGHKDK